MEKNIKFGMFLNTDHTATEEPNHNTYAVIFDEKNRMAVHAKNYDPDNHSALEAELLKAADEGLKLCIPTEEDLLGLATVRSVIKPQLKQLGVKLPKGQVWTKTWHDDCSYFTVDLKKSCVHYAHPEEICDIILLVRF